MITRIHPRIMRDIGQQLGHIPAGNSIGLDAVGMWTIAILRDGRIAVGSYGARLPAAMVERVIESYDGLDERDAVGSP